ncbi:MAG: MBOAT family protein [Sphingobacteriales bacterium]|nr:MAG: MBOAT family protein [Sphingobacteriales bacterium]
MLFNSIEFLLFFPIVSIAYYITPHKFRWLLVLLASCVFYMAFIPIYVLILLFTIVIDYFAGILIEQSEGKKRKYYLILSLCANIGVLAYFKYYNFFIENINQLLPTGKHFSILTILLPIGLSFHTFQAMSYTIEVYRKKQKAERHFGYYALYVMFYPQLVAGPIERPQNILYQLHQKHQFNYDRIVSGLRLILWGMFKKTIIADRMALIADPAFLKPEYFTGLPLIIATLAFSIQIYCDFSGYTDIAIGTARTMGINLMKNFNAPYFSKSIAEFWSRWHISLSTWFRDYLYIPLGGNRTTTFKWYRNLMLVFLISGFWHGANWTFIAWGCIHGIYLILSNVFFKNKQKKSTKIKSAFAVFTTFLLVTFTWIFFRASSIQDAKYIIMHLFDGIQQPIQYIFKGIIYLKLNKFSPIDFFVLGLSLCILFYVDKNINKISWSNWIKQKNTVVRWSIYFIMTFLIIAFGIFDNRQFIYFQF